MNEEVQSINKTKRSKLKTSPVAGPRTRVEPGRHLTDDMGAIDCGYKEGGAEDMKEDMEISMTSAT